jgi:hypothetical protein
MLYPCPLTFSLRAEGQAWRWVITAADGSQRDTGICASHKAAAAYIIRAICEAQLEPASQSRMAA